MNYERIKKNILIVLIINFFNLITGMINGFLIPAFLNIDNYALFKTYGLYIGYLGILSFGFLDGIYIKYGGESISKINKKQISFEYVFLLKFQILISVFVLIFGILSKNVIIITLSIAIIPNNFRIFFRFIFQATGELDSYSKIGILYSILLCLSNLIIIFFIKKDSYLLFIFVNLIISYIIFIIFDIEFRKLLWTRKKEEVDVIPIFKTGLFIMLGNLFAMLFYSMDRWFVKFLLTTKDFAYYSFAISMMNIINLLISSVAISLYPAFSRGYTPGIVKEIKKYLIIISSFSSLGYYAFSFIINMWLKKYTYSLLVISVLFAGLPAIAVINALYINLYKANKQERKYFYTVIKMAVVSFVLNVLAVILNKSNFTIAIATTLAFYIWFFYSSKDFEGLETNWREIFYILLFVSGFLFSTIKLPLLYGFVFLGIWTFILTMIFFKKEFVKLFRILISRE
ncbi:polysaccharide biosynthesis protein [Thermosipho ferrireducens]|uniref:Polysaccharide biosynthesis protein n=1 Tax=Thermosipho ferrireducens TaxID=2571116 RepID=A0ABX7S7C3_9BACT|nr:polysaccharide biosynthesis protein [Thermosipho ferrireducens]QTA38499.1 polysaccharide biosynthesis protein [Thermosipho ferrireducens]